MYVEKPVIKFNLRKEIEEVEKQNIKFKEIKEKCLKFNY